MSLAYDRAGSGPALVLLHPLGADRKVWRPVLDRLAAERDVICVDLPGFGESAPLAHRPDPAALACAVGGLLGELGVERPHLAGNSLGAWIAFELALSVDAASVTAIAPAGLWARPLPPKPEIARTLARIARPLLVPALRSEGVKRAALLGSVAHPERVPAEDAAHLIGAYASASGFTAVNRAMRAGVFARLGELRVPVTLAWCEHDRLVAPLRDAPARMRQVVLRGCGHIPMWDDPDAVACMLLEGSAVERVAAA